MFGTHVMFRALVNRLNVALHLQDLRGENMHSNYIRTALLFKYIVIHVLAHLIKKISPVRLVTRQICGLMFYLLLHMNRCPAELARVVPNTVYLKWGRLETLPN